MIERYFFERHELARETITRNTTIYVDEDDDEYDDQYDEHTDRDVLANWAIYDRHAGRAFPIAYVCQAEVAEKIVKALNA